MRNYEIYGKEDWLESSLQCTVMDVHTHQGVSLAGCRLRPPEITNLEANQKEAMFE